MEIVAVRSELGRVLRVWARCVFVDRCMRSAVAKGASHVSEIDFSHVFLDGIPSVP